MKSLGSVEYMVVWLRQSFGLAAHRYATSAYQNVTTTARRKSRLHWLMSGVLIAGSSHRDHWSDPGPSQAARGLTDRRDGLVDWAQQSRSGAAALDSALTQETGPETSRTMRQAASSRTRSKLLLTLSSIDSDR